MQNTNQDENSKASTQNEVVDDIDQKKTKEQTEAHTDTKRGSESSDEGESARKDTAKKSADSVKPEEVNFKEKYFYLAAEMENYRKRVDREKENLIKFGNERVLSDLIEVVDNFERTTEMLKHDEDPKVKNIVVGIDMVQKQFMETLTKHGLTPVRSLGEDFDPNFHEAMSQEYKEGVKPNQVINELQKGYTLNGRLIRAAKVIVASDKQ